MRPITKKAFILALMCLSFGCATGQLRRIEDRLGVLEARLEIFNENYDRTHDKSQQSLQDLYNTLRKQNELVQNNQNRMNSSLEDLSAEVLKMRRETDDFKGKMARVEARVDSAENILKTEVKGAQENLQKEARDNQAAMDKKMMDFQAQTRKSLTDLEAKLAKDIASSEDRNKGSINTLRNEVSSSFRDLEKIMRGLSTDNTVAPTSSGVSPDTTGTIHKVAPGETLSAIAQKYGVSTSEVIRVNNITDASKIQVGQEIVIPGR